MVPSHFVFLDSLPVTSNGKVDRRKLPGMDPGRPESQSAYVAPRSSIEKTLVGIWATVLQIERVGVEDNFFELGGHSLLATRLLSRIHQQFECDLPLRPLFEKPTVAELALEIERCISKGPRSSSARLASRSREFRRMKSSDLQKD
jgi:hypothetical protein